LRGGQRQSHNARSSLRESSNLVNVENALAKLRVAMEYEGSDFQDRLLAQRDKNNNAYFEIDHADVTSMKQSVDQLYKVVEQDDALGVTLHIKTAVRKLHSMLNRDEEELLTSDMLGEHHLLQEQLAAAPLDENAMSTTIHDLTMAVQEHDMDAVALHMDAIKTGLQSMIATVHYSFETDAVEAADFGNRILLLLHGANVGDFCNNLGDPLLCTIIFTYLFLILLPFTIVNCLLLCEIPAGIGKDPPEWCEKCDIIFG
jgi:hypothetical protein